MGNLNVQIWHGIQDLRAYSGHDVGSGHNLLVAKLELKLKKRNGSKNPVQTFAKSKYLIQKCPIVAVLNVVITSSVLEEFGKYTVVKEATDTT